MKKERTTEKNNKPFYKKWWFILIVIIVVIGVISSIKEGIKNAADKKTTYIWPDSALASLIPQPDSKYGRINMENENYFSIDIYKVSKESFEKYIEDCKLNGFTLDYMKSDNYYSADNEEGCSLHLSYDEKEKSLTVMLNAPAENLSPEKNAPKLEEENVSVIEKKENEDGDNSILAEDSEESSEVTEAEDETEINQSAAETSGDIRSEFKEVLDEYESFMNEYCNFMKKYANSDDVLAMTADYMRLLQEETEWLEKIDSLGNEEMNEAETKYYAEVTLRVSQKLLEVVQ